MKIDVSGVLFDGAGMEAAVRKAAELIEDKTGGYIVTPNPEIVWECRKNDRLRAAVASAALTLPDGVGIIIGARILGRPKLVRVPGIDFASALFKVLAGTGSGVFLLGAAPGVAEAARERPRETYPGLEISGARDGYFTDDADAVREIAETGARFVVVCLGSPRQELWMAEASPVLPGRLMIGLGGALDVLSGNTRRAPAFMRRLGLEWLYRLIRQPRRILRMMKLPAFIISVLWQRIRGRG